MFRMLPCRHLFENIIREAGVLSHIMQSPDKHWLMQVLTGLFDFVKEETHRNPLLNLAAIGKYYRPDGKRRTSIATGAGKRQ